jgi:hypothetical protein
MAIPPGPAGPPLGVTAWDHATLFAHDPRTPLVSPRMGIRSGPLWERFWSEIQCNRSDHVNSFCNGQMRLWR